MLVLNLMNENKNWKEVLSNAPYNIIIKEDGDYVLLKYNQLNSDFSNSIVRECRGSIFRLEDDEWICVCRAFDKFGNYGEDYVPEIDWNTAVVMEKIDGSLMKLWYDRNEWHLSTNGTINAFTAPLHDFEITFGQYFIECLAISFEELTDMLDKEYCYMFEMVGPKNRVVIGYNEAKLYGLGQRNMKTMEETIYSGPADDWVNIYLPERYSLSNLDEVIKVVKTMSKDEEGFVICDGEFNRMKIKSPEYLMAARLMNNGVVTRKRLMEIFLEHREDDFLAYCPQYRKEYCEIHNGFIRLWKDLLSDCGEVLVNEKYYFEMPRKEYAKYLSTKKYKDFLFKLRDGKVFAPLEYLESFSATKLLEMIDEVKKNDN